MTKCCWAAQLIDSGCRRSRRDPLDLDSELEHPAASSKLTSMFHGSILTELSQAPLI